MPGDYKTLRREASDAFIVNKSRFIGYAAPCETEDAALAFLRRIRDKHKDASHNCYFDIKRDILYHSFHLVCKTDQVNLCTATGWT